MTFFFVFFVLLLLEAVTRGTKNSTKGALEKHDLEHDLEHKGGARKARFGARRGRSKSTIWSTKGALKKHDWEHDSEQVTKIEKGNHLNPFHIWLLFKLLDPDNWHLKIEVRNNYTEPAGRAEVAKRKERDTKCSFMFSEQNTISVVLLLDGSKWIESFFWLLQLFGKPQYIAILYI